jgi:hypothetical protein
MSHKKFPVSEVFLESIYGIPLFLFCIVHNLVYVLNFKSEYPKCHMTWFHPVWYRKYQNYFYPVQILRSCRYISISTYKMHPASAMFKFAIWCGARLSASKNNAVNLILRLFLYHFLHKMSSWCHESIHNNTNNQQTPPPWWWSRSPLQWRGFDEFIQSEWRAAMLMFDLRPLLKGFGRINKLM